MGAYFRQQQAELAKRWVERGIYTAGPITLQPGSNPIFSAQNWTPANSPEWVAELVGIWTTQNTAVQLQWTFDSRQANSAQTQGFADAAPAGFRRMSVYAPAISQLIFQANNISTSPISNFQLNYEVQMRRLTIAEKLARGYNLSQDDQRILGLLGSNALKQIQDLVDKGTSPIGLQRQFEAILENQLLYDHPNSGLYHVSAGPTTVGTAFAIVPIPSGTFGILREVAVEGAAAITLYVDRDEDQGYLQLNGSSFVQVDDAPWLPILPAVRQLSFRAGALSSTTAAVRIRVSIYRLTNVWRVRLGIARSPSDVPGDTYAKVLAGLA
jgi:hypothetical protein